MLGAGNLPRQWDVVMVRVLKNIPEGRQIPVLGLSEISELFANNGLTLVTTEEENNPLIVRALFVRMQPVHSKSEFERLMAENADLIRAKSELRTQLEVEERAKISALLQRDAMAEELIATTKLRDELYAIGERIKAQLVNQQLQIQQFDASNQESIERHRLAHAELFKAEVQIELLKDLLKSESGL
jgi:aspartokinase